MINFKAVMVVAVYMRHNILKILSAVCCPYAAAHQSRDQRQGG